MHEIKNHDLVIKARHDSWVRKLVPGGKISIYLELDLKNNESIHWWLDIGCNDEQWFVELSVGMIHEQGEDSLEEYKNNTIVTIEDLILETNKISNLLINSVKNMDLASTWEQRKKR